MRLASEGRMPDQGALADNRNYESRDGERRGHLLDIKQM
jgi:hypothetical protein